MEATDLYVISDGDKGSVVASGLDGNFKGLLTEIKNVDSKGTDTYATKTELGSKVDKVTGKGLSTNDYTDEDKQKLAGLSNYDDSGIQEDIKRLSGDVTEILEAINNEQL